VVGQDKIKLMPVNVNSSLEKVLDMLPDLMEKANETIRKKITVKKEIRNGEASGKIVKEIDNDWVGGSKPTFFII